MATFLSLSYLIAAVAFLSFVKSEKYHSKYFEIARPILKPVSERRCSIPVLKNDKLRNSPFTVNFEPPTNCGKDWSLITLSWSAYLNNSWYQSTGNVFIDGLNVLKTSAEATSVWPYFDGADSTWSFETDITKYKAFLTKKRLITVSFFVPGSNIIANLTLNYYSGTSSLSHADTIVPLSPNSAPRPFQLTSASKKGQVLVSGLPRNTYRAEIEVFQIHGGSDYQYWNNYPDKFIATLPPDARQSYTGGGSFRETLVYIDGLLAGAIWQFPVSIASDIVEWNPVRAIGAFSVPSYKIDITPFVGMLVDGKSHTFAFGIVSPSNGSLWEVSGALHLWQDKKSKQTSGKLISRQIENTLTPSVTYKYKSDVGAVNTTTRVLRKSSISGYVSSSFGNFTATSTSSFGFSNDLRTTFLVSDNSPSARVITTTQTLQGSAVVNLKFKNGSQLFQSLTSVSFPLTSIHYYDGYQTIETISHGYISNSSIRYSEKYFVESLSNTQTGNLSVYYHGGGVGDYLQTYSYRSNFQGCYYRKVNVSNSLFLLNQARRTC